MPAISVDYVTIVPKMFLSLMVIQLTWVAYVFFRRILRARVKHDHRL